MRFLLLLPILLCTSSGFADTARDVRSRILNGQDTEWVPYTTSVFGFYEDYDSVGSGSFITHRHVLSSAKLVYNAIRAYVLYADLQGESATALPHPDYDPSTYANDIGLLFLANAVDPGEPDDFLNSQNDGQFKSSPFILIALVTIIPLPMAGNYPLVNEQGQVSGIGMHFVDGEWVQQTAFQTAYFRRVTDSVCDNLLGDGISIPETTSFCAQDLDNGASICYGDLGAGLTVFIDEVNTLVGIVSIFTNMCHKDYPVIFTRVAPYTSWILEQVAAEELKAGL